MKEIVLSILLLTGLASQAATVSEVLGVDANGKLLSDPAKFAASNGLATTAGLLSVSNAMRVDTSNMVSSATSRLRPTNTLAAPPLFYQSWTNVDDYHSQQAEMGWAWNSTDGLCSSGITSAGRTNFYKHPMLTTIEDVDLSCAFISDRAGTVIGIGKVPTDPYQVGNVALVNFPSNSLELWQYYGTNITLVTSTNLIETGYNIPYRLSVHKSDSSHVRIELSSPAGTVVLPYYGFAVNFSDSPVLLTMGATGCRIKYWQLSTRYKQNPRLLLLGDSYTEGNSIWNNLDARFAALTRDYMGVENVAIAGRGGESYQSIGSRLTNDLNYFSPQYTFVLLQNDGNTNTILGYVSNVVNAVKARGSIPILGTIAPASSLMGVWNTASRSNYVQFVNNWIRNKSWQMGCRFVDVNYALSSNHLGQVMDEAYNIGDGVHPNAAGHRAIFDRMLADIPDVLGKPVASWLYPSAPTLAEVGATNRYFIWSINSTPPTNYGGYYDGGNTLVLKQLFP